ncbi:MAG: hypothetical protein CLLPBCKN_004517 [Chroococcidiopsis cubana SAG 39.79]|jgi:periplasmic protein TonB|uniref:Outer membrane transport energization protein TonB n=2 Tax=Chroococcidiopsis TaxID=54298 RepID=K9TYE8_CHRTP|nr:MULTISPECIES: energy transducer TonB [Chroococcidiopsis]PSB40903.1 energy transducer TonB [Cyanosarcina cf. burmensis CCALA 770]AFY87403.1 outer membrane transport energization protein TonB [Chroococcidiopsis thermalis PCC 7203]MDZ4875121.1 hypothetical protein [Chroococcidiopsis cubana SAG 39.79]PSB61295.1 energy transducer TonB [Chroococcidiopsis cubana CCALA 043]RUT09398.1 hypothetical protein DSM107010_45140 [Chroococcidiopsis cubana SAG 39.79]
MGSDNVAIQQREKEARSLKTLLACSLVGSVALHVGLLYAGIDKLWQRNFTQPPKPIEVVIVNPPKKPEVKKPEPKPEPPKPKPQPRRVQQPRVRQPQRVVRQTPPPKVVRATPKPVPRAVAPKPAPPPPPVATPNPQLRSQLSNLRNERATQEKVLTGRGNPQAPAVAPRTPVAAGPRTVRQPRSETGDSEGSNTLTCRRCPEPRYPASARRRGVEGVPKVAFYVDSDGNVSNAQLVQSSGDADLDAAALRQVTRWKYNDLKRGRRVVLRVRFVLN